MKQQNIPTVRTFSVVACIMYSKDLNADSENLVWSRSSSLPSGCILTLSKDKLLTNKICKKDWEEYIAHLENSPRNKVWAIWQMDLGVIDFFFFFFGTTTKPKQIKKKTPNKQQKQQTSKKECLDSQFPDKWSCGSQASASLKASPLLRTQLSWPSVVIKYFTLLQIRAQEWKKSV